APSGISIEAPVFAEIARRISPKVEFLATTDNFPSIYVTSGAAAGLCSGVSGSVSIAAAGVLAAVTCTPSPVTQAMGDPCAGASPFAVHGVPCAMDRMLVRQRQADNASDFGPKCIIASLGESGNLCERRTATTTFAGSAGSD